MCRLGFLLQAPAPESARRWYEKAAQAGEPSAMTCLGVLLKPSDPEAARSRFEQAAQVGQFDAMLVLGRTRC